MIGSSLPGLFYLNALFDPELGGYPVESVRAGAREMGSLFAFCGTKNDRILLEVNVPDDYWKYLDSLAIPYAPLLSANDNPSEFSGVAWGWNEKSIERFSSLGVNCRHPDLQAVKTVNNRSFCATFNHTTRTGVPGTRFCASMDEARKTVHDLNNQFPLVAKPAFGGSGSGFITLRNSDQINGSVEKPMMLHGCTIEPWCDRLYDVSSSCFIKDDGTVSNLRHYRTFANKRGAFYGVAFGDENDKVVKKYREELGIAVDKAVRGVFDVGYFGPVGFDSFVYRDATNGNERLAAIIEINGRYIMSSIAHALHTSVGLSRSCYFRFLGRKTCAMPASYDECRDALGRDWYDPEERRGIILLSPLRSALGKTWCPPVRNAFFIVGLNSDGVRTMDDRLRALFNP